MNRKIPAVLSASFLALSLMSCNQYIQGTIYFDLSDGHFPSNFTYSSIKGRSGSYIELDIPDPVKEGYYFVGWRERVGDSTKLTEFAPELVDGEEKYQYPFGTTTWVAYFEPLVTIDFNLTEGAEKDGALVAPVRDSEYDASTGTLQGYTTMSIPSTDYLPTATADHLNFQYWYTRYPLVGTEDEETGVTRYSLDETKPLGKYPFSTGFSSSSLLSTGMAFPMDDDGTFTLYAEWTEDPTVSIHYNLGGVEDDVFQVAVGEDLSAAVVSAFEKKLGMNLDSEGYKYYGEDRKYRFAGLYFDAALTSPFPIREAEDGVPIEGNVTLYAKWDEKVHLTLDYGGGTLDGQKSFESDDFYSGDVLGTAFADSHRPEKAEADFTGYTYDGALFRLETDALPLTEDRTVTLTATYSDYPSLTIVTDYPDDALDTSVDIGRIEAGTSIASLVEKAWTDLDDSAKTEGYALMKVLFRQKEGADSWTSDVVLGNMVMPQNDTVVTLQAGYKSVVTIHTLVGAYGQSYAEHALPDSYETTRYFGSTLVEDDGDAVVHNDSYSESSLRYAEDRLDIGGVAYLYDGMYVDEAMTEPLLPGAAVLSQEKAQEVAVYQKYTKAIHVAVVDEDGTSLLDGDDLLCLPEAPVATIYDKIPGFDPDTQKIYIHEDGRDYEVLKLPTSDCTLIVK